MRALLRAGIGVLAGLAWWAVLSAAWLGVVAMAWGAIAKMEFGFAGLSPSAWRKLHADFLGGAVIPFPFAATILAVLVVGLAGECLLAWRLPTLMSWAPSFPAPPSFAPRPARRAPPAPKRAPVSITPPPAPPEPPAPVEMALPAQAEPPAGEPGADGPIVARMLALLDVWTDPPPDWMRNALADEASRLSPAGWPLLQTLGPDAGRVIDILRDLGLLPEQPAFILEPPPPRLDAEPPALSMGASWLCEVLDNFLSLATEDIGGPAEVMLHRAIRAMTERDWASLDRFPDRAAQVRILSDRLGEKLRRSAGVPRDQEPLDQISDFLRQAGFQLGERGAAGLLAERPELALICQLIDLGGKTWPVPEDPLLLPPWLPVMRSLRRHLALERLRSGAELRRVGLVVTHNGRIGATGLAHDQPQSPDLRMAAFADHNAVLPSWRRSLEDLIGNEVTAGPNRQSRALALEPP